MVDPELVDLRCDLNLKLFPLGFRLRGFLLCDECLLVLGADLGTFFQGELGVLAVDAFDI